MRAWRRTPAYAVRQLGRKLLGDEGLGCDQGAVRDRALEEVARLQRLPVGDALLGESAENRVAGVEHTAVRVPKRAWLESEAGCGRYRGSSFFRTPISSRKRRQ